MPTMTEIFQDIGRHLHESFGDTEAPNYTKISARLEARSAWPELSSIIQVFWTKDVTDVNEDISMCLLLKDGADEFRLELSAVGPYAILLKLVRDSCRLMSSEEILADTRLVAALHIALQSRTFLSRNTLEEEIAFGSDASRPTYSKVYNALFSDIDILPWES